MFQSILVGVDGSQGSKAALRMAIAFARQFNARLRALAVEEHMPRFAATVGETQEAQEEKDAFFRQVMKDAYAIATEEEVGLETEIVRGNPSRAIVDRARQLAADLIVIGHSNSAWGNLLGSTADRVVDHAHCTVLIVR
ncbi:MAG: universal stress protein [Chloroflexi bacterium]|nr:universal stress protein [Chloroflexota bacterium]